MERLTFQTLEKIGYQGYLLKDAPERVLQFGESTYRARPAPGSGPLLPDDRHEAAPEQLSR